MDGFGQKVLELRRAFGWSQPRLAEHLGVKVKTVSAWECGQNKSPRAETYIKLLELFQSAGIN
jgi:transcriptional regulator with XRE-family HTH domain